MKDAPRRLFPIGWDAFGLLAGIAILTGACWIVRPGPDLEVGSRAPDTRLALVANGTGSVRLGAGKGRVTVVEFFASWCGTCRTALPQVDRALAGSGARFIAVSVDRDERAARAAARNWHLSGRVTWDNGGRAAAAYGLRSLPTLFVIDRAGRVSATHTGPVAPGTLHADIARAAADSLGAL